MHGDEVILNLKIFTSNDLLVLGVYIIYKSSCEERETTRKVGEGAQWAKEKNHDLQEQ